MTKQLFLALMACTLVIAPGCTKRTKLAPEQMNSEQLEKERKKYTTRGAILTATSPVVIGAGLTGFMFGAVQVALCADPFVCGSIAIVGVGATVGGIYMLGQGIHDLAKAKKLRRIQMKQAAQQRRLEREMAAQNMQAEVIK